MKDEMDYEKDTGKIKEDIIKHISILYFPCREKLCKNVS